MDKIRKVGHPERKNKKKNGKRKVVPSVTASESILDLIDSCRKLAGLLHRSGPAIAELKKACVTAEIPFTKVKNPNATRWNSIFLMIESILKLKPAWQVLNITEVHCGTLISKLLTTSQLKLADGVVKVLERVLLTTKKWEADKTPTLQFMVYELFELDIFLEGIVKGNDAEQTKEFAKCFQTNLRRRFPDCGTGSSLYAISHYLDPKFKGVILQEYGMFMDTKEYIKSTGGKTQEMIRVRQ